MTSIEVVLSVVSITLLIFLLVAGIVLVFFRSGRQRLKQQMELTQNKLKYEQELRQVETEVSEEMMKQFAQELHDNIGQLITAVGIQIENIKFDHRDLKEEFKSVEIYLSEATQQLRLLSRTLNSDYVGRIGLFSAVDTEVKRIKSLNRFTVHWKPVSGNSGLEKDQELMVFRVFQEVIQNCLRHSLAQNVSISLKNEGGNFEMKIKDDGLGFDAENILYSDKASGLRNIMKRCEWIGMSCNIESSVGKGCTITVNKNI